MLIRVELSKIIIDEKRQDQIIVLREKEGERQFPIIIGFLEASSIKMKLAGVEAPRPMTHDLLVNTIDGLEAKIERIIIDKLVDNTFHAKLEVKSKDGRVAHVDARPSDCIALAVRASTPIFVEEEVLNKAAISRGE